MSIKWIYLWISLEIGDRFKSVPPPLRRDSYTPNGLDRLLPIKFLYTKNSSLFPYSAETPENGLNEYTKRSIEIAIHEWTFKMKMDFSPKYFIQLFFVIFFFCLHHWNIEKQSLCSYFVTPLAQIVPINRPNRMPNEEQWFNFGVHQREKIIIWCVRYLFHGAGIWSMRSQ